MSIHGTLAPGDLQQWNLTVGITIYGKYYIMGYDASEDPKTLNVWSATDLIPAGILMMSTKVFDDKYGAASAAAAALGNNIGGVARKGRFPLLMKAANSAIKKGDKVIVVADTITIEGVARATTPCVDLAPAYTALPDDVLDSSIGTLYDEMMLEIGQAAEAKGASTTTGERILVDVDIPIYREVVET